MVMKLYNNITETIGNTPIIKIDSLSFETGSNNNIYAKLECFNPGRSVKDRIALNIVHEAEKSNSIDDKTIIMESSSGNTGIGISIISRVKGYKNIIVVDQNCPVEKIKMLKAYGAIILRIRSSTQRNADLTERRIEFISKAKEMMENLFIPNQYENSMAPQAHYTYTAEEIINFMESTNIRFQVILISVGTGGTITGVSKRIKEYDNKIKIIGVEPDGSTLFGGVKGPYLQQGPGNYFKPKNLIYDCIDSGMKVNDSDAFNMCRQMAVTEGLLLGGSSGGLLYKAREIASIHSGNILCILPDSGEKYLDTIYNDEWLEKNNIDLDEKNKRKVFELDIDNFSYSELFEQIKEEVFL